MKTVLLLGDSIRMGYDKAVRRSLAGVAEVVFPGENTRFASYLLRHFHEYLKEAADGRVDVIHWNAGLWDCLRLFGEEPHTPLDVYAYYIERICIRIRKLCPDARVIFATSTKVISERMDENFKRYNEEIEVYNKAAVRIAEKYGLVINDLYALSKTLPESVHSDAVHYYTPEGTRAFTKQVLASLGEALGLSEVPQYLEELYTDKPIGI